jgi:hypothetical protein
MAVTAPIPTFLSSVEYPRYHQVQSARSNEPPPDSPSLRTSIAPAPYSTDNPLSWRPFYLRRVVLLSLIIVFILIIVAIESLLAVSNRDNGIATSTTTKHYLWTYGPTAFLTVVAALWARTEYQSQLVGPLDSLVPERDPCFSHASARLHVSIFVLRHFQLLA